MYLAVLRALIGELQYLLSNFLRYKFFNNIHEIIDTGILQKNTS